MSMFNRGRSATPASGVSVVGEQLVVHGNLDTDGTIRVDGRVTGTGHRAGTLIVGARGSIVGSVEARDVIIAGTVDGNVHARGRVEVEPGATVQGDIRAASLVLRDGGVVNGHLAVGRDASTPVATPVAMPKVGQEPIRPQLASQSR